MNEYPMYREISEYGNDCMIYKTIQLSKIADKFLIVVAEMPIGGWFEHKVETFGRNDLNEEQALEYFKNYE